jgi:polyisoprenyl-phosphate glycosyltransferase
MAEEKKLVSIVLPVHNEAEVLPELYRQICEQLTSLAFDFELIFVNDGSTDTSLALLRGLHAGDPRVRCIDLSRNYGHQAALTAGTHAARGDAVIHMDADLQHPPALIPTFIEKWKAGVQIVETQRLDTGEPGVKPLLSSWFYRIFNSVSSTRIVPGGSDFRLLDRMCVDALNAIPERDRFLRGLTQWIGFSRELVTFEPQKRAAGTPSYTLKKSVALALDGLFHFSSLPLRLAFYAGASLILLCGIYLGVGIVLYFTTDKVMTGWVSTILAVTLMGGINLMFTGVLSVYVWKIFDQTRQRPVYIIRETLGLDHMGVVGPRVAGPTGPRPSGVGRP